MKSVALALILTRAVLAAVHPEAGSVLIVVNDAVRPEAGSGTKGASVYVGEYYAQQRGVPTSQIVHLNLPMAGGSQGTPQDWDSWHTDWAKLTGSILQPIKQFLADNNLTNKINYIVPVYGIPTHSWDSTHTGEGLSIDTFIASINAPRPDVGLFNPYFSFWNEGKLHIRNYQNPAGWKLYLVTRLDGPTMKAAIGLVDKAIHAEANLKATDGIAYFDYRNLAQGDSYQIGDQSVLNAYAYAKSLGFQTVLNNNGSDNNKMIHNAPNTLWAWGWYSGPFTWDGYQFVEGAVGAQLTSYTASNIRAMGGGTWVPLWINAGITATWGATTEPFLQGYADGDNLLNKFWSGYNFAESAYQALPLLNHAMIFLGDPLYAPKIFQQGKLTMKPPYIGNGADGTLSLSPGTIAVIAGSGLSNCTAANHGTTLQTTLCGTTVTMNGSPIPLFYVSPSQINVLVPRGLAPGQDVPIGVTREDGDSGTGAITGGRLVALSPAIFLWAPDGVLRAIVQNSDYSTNGPGIPGTRPMKLGEAGVIYASGLGPTDVALADTAPAPLRGPLVHVQAQVQVFVNGKAQSTFFAGMTPGQFGLYQVNFVLDPQTLVFDGDQNAVWLNVDGAETPHVRISLTK